MESESRLARVEKIKSMIRRTDNLEDPRKGQDTLKRNTLSDRIDSVEKRIRSIMQALVKNRSDGRGTGKEKDGAVLGGSG